MAYIVIGCGNSSLAAINLAESCLENWALAREQAAAMARVANEEQHAAGSWCVVVDGIDESELDGDPATIIYAEYRPIARDGEWNVYRWLTADGSKTLLLGSSADKGEAQRIADRLGGSQIQWGMDGVVEGV